MICQNTTFAEVSVGENGRFSPFRKSFCRWKRILSGTGSIHRVLFQLPCSQFPASPAVCLSLSSHLSISNCISRGSSALLNTGMNAQSKHLWQTKQQTTTNFPPIPFSHTSNPRKDEQAVKSSWRQIRWKHCRKQKPRVTSSTHETCTSCLVSILTSCSFGIDYFKKYQK